MIDWMFCPHVTSITFMTVTHRHGLIAAAVAAVVLTACGSSDAASPTVPVVSEVDTSLPPMDIVAGLGYPRDLLDRGRVNIRISRHDDLALVLFDKQLVSDFFTPAPVEQRRTVLPPNGQVVAVQTLFGEVSDCDDPALVTASLHVTYAAGQDPSRRTGVLPLTDATTLDQIRMQKCTVRRVLENNDITVRDGVDDSETMTANLVITRRSGTDRLAFDSIKGTVLFGASSPTEPGAADRVLEPDEQHTVIALLLDVNRCDAHAVAETTRKFGIDVYVSVDGAESQRIDVPIDSILPQLDAMLERCKSRTGQ